MDNSEQLELENIIHDQKMEGGSSQKSGQQELKEREIQKLRKYC